MPETAGGNRRETKQILIRLWLEANAMIGYGFD